MTTSPVDTSVSAATRAYGSCFRIASSTASEIWSATLSGWPSDTDSEENKNSLIERFVSAVRRPQGYQILYRFPRILLRLAAALPLAALHRLGSVLGRIMYGMSPT